jgi:L-tartrate/succinate antiporter
MTSASRGDTAALGRTALPPHGFVPRGSSPDLWRFAVPVLTGAVLAAIPAPHGLAPYAWHYFALFAAVILALITEPLPAGAVGLIGVTFAATFGLVFTPAQMGDPAFRFPAEALKWALAGFINSTVWLIFAAFVFAIGYEKTGLGRRMALVLVKRLGGHTLGLGYAIALADLVLAPFTPSNTARSAGTVFPVIRGIPALYGSAPGASGRRIGAYIMWVAFATTCVTSSLFVTALAPNLLALELVRRATGVEITWTAWLRGSLPIGGPLLIVLPWLVYTLYPPEIRRSAEVPRWAGEELAKLGPLTAREMIMAALAIGALALWIAGGRLIDPTMVALVAISLMLVGSVVSWDDIIGNAAAWNVLVWFATLVVLADGLSKVGVVDWIGRGASALLAGHSPTFVMIMLVVLFFVLHYMFASLVAHTTALLPVFVAAGASVPGMPIRVLTMLLVFSLGLMGVLTPYATGPAPVYFASGYIAAEDFWRLGFVFGLIFLGVLLLVGVPYLTMTYH